MTRARLTAARLLVHVFLTAGSQDASEGWNRPQALWNDITRRGGAPGWQASAWADGGILGLTVMMAPVHDPDSPGAWADLERTWVAARADHASAGVLGEARIFLALAAGPPGMGLTHTDPDREILDLVRAAAPEPPDSGWWPNPDAIPAGALGTGADAALVWETGPKPGDAPMVRRLTVVATGKSERGTDLLPMVDGDGPPAPLGRHLMHAARLRHQIRLFGEDKRPHRLRDELGLLISVFSSGAALDPGPVRDLADRGRLSARLRPAHEAAIALRAELGTMRQSVDAATDGMRKALAWPAAETGTGPLSQDRDLATAFGQRLDDEIAEVDAAIRSAQLVRRSLTERAPEPARRPGHTEPDGLAQASSVAFHPQPRTGPREGCVVVFTALGVEYTAIREYLTGPVWQHEERGTLYEVGTLPGVRGHWQIALTQTGPGSTNAGVQLDRAVRVFAPRAAFFLGTAGGRKDVDRGDVVVADMIYDYEWGKSTVAGFQPRIRIHWPSHRLLQRAQLVVRESRWQRRILPSCPDRPPTAFVKPIVTGGKVIAHDQSEVALLIDRYADDALAVETEGHGFLAAAYVNPELDALVIRGISDLLVGKTKANDDYWQPAASRHAAAFAIEMLDSIGAGRAW